MSATEMETDGDGDTDADGAASSSADGRRGATTSQRARAAANPQTFHAAVAGRQATCEVGRGGAGARSRREERRPRKSHGRGNGGQIT